MTTTPGTWKDGLRDIAPILLSMIPFALIFGVTAAAAEVDHLAAWASSFIVFAGASQIALVEVLDSGGTVFVAVSTAVIINARMVMYSADIGRYTRDLSAVQKLSVAYPLTDQAYLVTVTRYPDSRDAPGVLPYYLGAAFALWTTWQVATTVGMLLGAAVPDGWSLEFAVPLVFVALLVLAIRSRPGLVAAVVGGSVALVSVPLPYNLGLLVGAFTGVAAGVLAERWTE